MVFRKKAEKKVDLQNIPPVAPIQQNAPVAPTPQQAMQTVEQQVQQPIPQQVQNTEWIVQQIATATEPVIYNPQTGEQLDLYSAIAEILNRTE
jgi:hypothetical protein